VCSSVEAAVMAVERRHLINSNVSNNMGGRGEMIKTPINLQDLRRKIYIKAKAEKKHCEALAGKEGAENSCIVKRVYIWITK
jgi:hypothetical protein